MWKADELARVTKKHVSTLENLKAVATLLEGSFHSMQHAVRALVLSAISKEPLLLIGPPGTGKSLLIRAFCHLLGYYNMHDKAHAGASGKREYFEYLLTPFTEPTELWGFYDVSALLGNGNGEKRVGQSVSSRIPRLEEGMMRQAKVVYLDEVFNGSSAILNSLLAFMNEGFVHDRGEMKEVEWKALFAATNTIPTSTELRAFYDRFVLRCWVDNARSRKDDLVALLTTGWKTTYTKANALTFNQYGQLIDKLDALRSDLRTVPLVTVPDKAADLFAARLTGQVAFARNQDLSDVSNRRLVKMVYIMMCNRAYRAVVAGEKGDLAAGEEELQLIARHFLDSRDDEFAVEMHDRMGGGALDGLSA